MAARTEYPHTAGKGYGYGTGRDCLTLTPRVRVGSIGPLTVPSNTVPLQGLTRPNPF